MKIKSVKNILKNMRKQAGPACRQAGFTLIELLVVIGILGILASALIATIDPFEQLKKANDSNAKNTAVEFVSAATRSYTTHNALPWASTASGGAGCNGTANPTAVTLSAAAFTGCNNSLISDGELKAGFTNVTSLLNGIYVSGTSNSVTSCFLPQSKSQQRDPNAIFNSSGVNAANCLGATSTGSACYWCTQ